MSEQSPRMEWAYPSREDDPWFDVFKDFVIAVDGSGFAHREDRSIIWSGGGTLSWDLASKTFTWTDTINAYSPMSAKLIQIAAGSITDWGDGQVIYVDLVRLALTNTARTLVKANTVDSSDDAMAVAVRIGSRLYFRTGMSIGDGESVSGISPSPGGGDPNAIHVNVAAEIDGIAAKATPTISDVIVIEDAADSLNKKKALLGNLPGISTDRYAPAIVVGNSGAGDTINQCHYLDTGDGAQLAAALADAALNQKDVYIRPGTYDLGSGGTPTEMLTIPAGITVRGAGRDLTTIVTATAAGLSNHAFALSNFSVLSDVGVFCPEPVGNMLPTTDQIVCCAGIGGLVERVTITFDNYWATMASPTYTQYTYGAFGSVGVTTTYETNKFVDCKAVEVPYDTVLQMASFDAYASSKTQVERGFGEGGTVGANAERRVEIVNSVFWNESLAGWWGILLGGSADYSQIIGNEVAGLFSIGTVAAISASSANGLVVSNNQLAAFGAVLGAPALEMINSDDGSYTGNVAFGFVDGVDLNALSDDNVVLGNNFGGSAVIDAGTGNDLAHNK